MLKRDINNTKEANTIIQNSVIQDILKGGFDSLKEELRELRCSTILNIEERNKINETINNYKEEKDELKEQLIRNGLEISKLEFELYEMTEKYKESQKDVNILANNISSYRADIENLIKENEDLKIKLKGTQISEKIWEKAANDCYNEIRILKKRTLWQKFKNLWKK